MYFGLERQLDNGGRVIRDTTYAVNNVYLNGVRIAAVLPNGSARYYLTDQVDSVKVVVDDDGLPVTRFEYLPYGETWFTEEKTGLEEEHNPKFNSQELDKETGYYFYNARHYDPEIGRFVTGDTVIDGEGDTQGWNRFSYVKGNPVRYKDPTGHAGVADDIKQGLDDAGDAQLEQSQKDWEQGSYGSAIWEGYKGVVNKAASFLAPTTEEVDMTALMGAGVSKYGATRITGIIKKGANVVNALATRISRGAKGVGNLLKNNKVVKKVGEKIYNFSNRLKNKFSKGAAKHGAKGGKELLSFSKSNFRKNLIKLTGKNPGKDAMAHHVFPQKFGADFQKIGINIHDPKFGTWWNSSNHLQNAASYNKTWQQFLRNNPSKSQALDFGRKLMKQYGQTVGY
jgi:RHS repeat-associated protein